MSKISQATIQFIRSSLKSYQFNLVTAGLHILEGATNSAATTCQIIGCPIPAGFEEWYKLFKADHQNNNRYVYVWLLGRFAELGIEWALNLHELSLTGKSLYALPYNLGSLENIEVMDFSGNNLDDLPKSIGKMLKLTKLYIHDNEFTFIPDWIGELQLELLYAVGNPLRQLPIQTKAFAMDETLWVGLHDELHKLAALESMLFQGLSFPCDHRWLENQTALRRLSFDDCELWCLPNSLQNCSNLEYLQVIGTSEFTLGDEIAFHSKLKTLILDEGEIRTLPKGLGECKSLDSLTVAYQELSRVPPVIQRLRELTVLNLNGNDISTIPMWIGRQKNLKVLRLSNNDLATLPNTISNLQSLEILDLSNNLLDAIPDCLYKLTGLRKLKLEGNHIPFEQVLKLQCALPDCQIGFGAMVE